MAFPKGQKQGEITPKQLRFIKNYTEKSSPTFGNASKSYIAAGYKNGVGVQQSSSKLLSNPVISSAIAKHIAPTVEISVKRQEINKEYALSKLQETYEAAEKKGDITNQVACVRLMMQHNGMLIERVAVDIEDSRRIETSNQAQAKRIAAFMVSRGLLNPGDPAQIHPRLAVVSREIQPQDIVDTQKSDDNNNNVMVNGDAQVIENKEDMESTSDKSLL